MKKAKRMVPTHISDLGSMTLSIIFLGVITRILFRGIVQFFTTCYRSFFPSPKKDLAIKKGSHYTYHTLLLYVQQPIFRSKLKSKLSLLERGVYDLFKNNIFRSLNCDKNFICGLSSALRWGKVYESLTRRPRSSAAQTMRTSSLPQQVRTRSKYLYVICLKRSPQSSYIRNGLKGC